MANPGYMSISGKSQGVISAGCSTPDSIGNKCQEGRTDTEGPLRRVYRQAAVALGGEEEAGDVAYGVVDISTSLYSLLRLVRRPDAWRLYRYIRTDYVRSYRGTSVVSIALDSAVNYFTGKDSLEKWKLFSE